MHALVAPFPEREARRGRARSRDRARPHDSHWDHAVHRAVLAALRRARCGILTYATRLPAGAASPPATCVVDISSSIDRKVAAIAEYASQFPPGFAEARRHLARTLGHTRRRLRGDLRGAPHRALAPRGSPPALGAHAGCRHHARRPTLRRASIASATRRGSSEPRGVAGVQDTDERATRRCAAAIAAPTSIGVK